MVGIVPCYLKNHSQGEYVFDHGWADAFERAGGSYYPKLQASVRLYPGHRASPAGPRRRRRGANRRRDWRRPDRTCATRRRASSVHVTFAREDEWTFLAKHGFLQRTDQQFHWRNKGYATFEDFLNTLNARHRKAIRRERRNALENGVTIHALTGDAITPDAWDAFFAFYMETGSRKWGRPYLTREFYRLIGETMADNVLLVMAKREGQWIAGAINFIGSDALYGRNWGAIEEHPFLHFEICYYQAIDFAIRRGLKRVEAGAQGEHKIARGYLPQTTLFRALYRRPIAAPRGRRLSQARTAIRSEAVRELTDAGPFRKGANDK